MTFLSREMDRAFTSVKQPHLDALRNLGIAPATIARLGVEQAPFGVLSGTIDPDSLFVPGDGPARVIQPIMSGGVIIDLVAWRTLQPDAWSLRVGTGWCLGEDNLFGDPAKPVLMSATPLDWLRNGATGFCVLDWASPQIGVLRNVERIAADRPELGKLLLHKLSRPERLPRLVTWEANHEQAA